MCFLGLEPCQLDLEQVIGPGYPVHKTPGRAFSVRVSNNSSFGGGRMSNSVGKLTIWSIVALVTIVGGCLDARKPMTCSTQRAV